jgi:dTDP-4-amino-4,6-dideoxygalactose transaminase
MIPVTKSFLPPIEEYMSFVKKAYDNQWLTNRGELVVSLENKLKDFLNVNQILITNNGTIPLQIALKILGNGGEIITTPFSYIATTSSIVWEHCKPVFVDIHPEYLTIDEDKIEAAITEKTTCILATHVFGNPCDVDKIEAIAKKYNLKVIYDAAHCFAVTYNGNSIFNYGDISTCSFHATKLFHTGEGGAVFCNDETLTSQVYYSHNFGHISLLNIGGVGVNGKISELQAAMGHAVLPHMDSILKSRKSVIEFYDNNINFNKYTRLKIRENTSWNYSYYPIIFNSEEELLAIEKKMNDNKIFPRRYFFPSLNTLNYLEYNKMPVSESISNRILCLPLYFDMSETDLQLIVKQLEL